MTEQAKINAQLAEAYERYFTKENERIQRYVISEVETRTRYELIELLNEYAKKDNTISKARINSLLRDLDESERRFFRELIKAMDEALNQSATSAVLTASAILAGVFALGGSFTGFTEAQAKSIAKDAVSTTKGRLAKSSSDMLLEERLRRLSGEYTDAVRSALRAGILQGRSVNSLVADLRKVYDAETWKLRRIVITEGNTAFRAGTAQAAKESDVVKGVQLIDHTGHKRHEYHECYRLARQNPYGWGAGIYRPEDTYIYSPHPKCRATLLYILKDDALRGAMNGGGNA